MRFPPVQSWIDWLVMGFFLHIGWILLDPVVALLAQGAAILTANAKG